jgi:hypothetical protein
MGAEEQGQDQPQDFTFKQVDSVEIDNEFHNSDVVEIVAEERIDDPQPDNEVDNVDQNNPTDLEPDFEEEEEDAVYDLDEELAFNFLKEKKGLQFENIDDFIKSGTSKKVDPEFEKYQEYKAKTGRGYGDFLETQKDWSKENPETIIKATLKLENPELSNEDIDFLFDKDYAFDEETDDDYDIRSKKINLKVDAKKALATLEKQKEDYLVERGSDDNDIPEIYKEAKDLVERLYDEQTENEEVSKVLRNDFVSKTQSLFNDKFEGFKIKIDGQEFKVKPEDIKSTRENQLDIANFQKKFFDKENRMTDAEGYHRSLYAAMDPEKFATHFFNLGKASYAENLEKESKNIDVTGQKHVPDPALSAFTFKKVS